MLIVREERGQRLVEHGCAIARCAGVRPGMTLAHARALLSPRAIHEAAHDPAADGASLARLVRWAERWSPVVEADPPGGLLLDITGCEHLFGGEERLARSLRRGLARVGFTARIGAAGTIGAAWALARFGPAPIVHIPTGGERAALAPLPICALRVSAEVVAGLAEVGIERVGQLLGVPRSALPSRFGDALLLRLDQVLGSAIELVRVTPAEAPLAASIELPGGTTDAASLDAAACAVLGELCAALAGRESGLRRLLVTLDRLGTTPEVLAIDLSRPSRSARHLWSLLRPRLERVNLGFGVEKIGMGAMGIARVAHVQSRLCGERERPPIEDSAAGELLDTIAGRVGAERVQRMELVQSHQPERLARLVPLRAGVMAGGRTAMFAPPPLRPSVLLDPPELVRVIALTPDGPVMRFSWRGEEHEVAACEGPERIAPEWWRTASRAASVRDYFRVQTSGGRWVWLFREDGMGASGGWFAHGEWC